MRRVILAVTFLAFAFPSLSATLLAADDPQTARGTVKAIGPDWLTVAVGERELKFTVDEQTSVVARGAGTATRRAAAGARPAPRFAEFVTVGKAVLISYLDRDGALYASDIHVISSAGPGGGSLSSDAPSVKTATGTVASIGADSLVVSIDGRPQTFYVDGHTDFYAKGASTKTAAAGGRVPFADLVSEGDRVSISYHELDGVMHAQDVRVSSRP